MNPPQAVPRQVTISDPSECVSPSLISTLDSAQSASSAETYSQISYEILTEINTLRGDPEGYSGLLTNEGALTAIANYVAPLPEIKWSSTLANAALRYANGEGTSAYDVGLNTYFSELCTHAELTAYHAAIDYDTWNPTSVVEDLLNQGVLSASNFIDDTFIYGGVGCSCDSTNAVKCSLLFSSCIIRKDFKDQYPAFIPLTSQENCASVSVSSKWWTCSDLVEYACDYCSIDECGGCQQGFDIQTQQSGTKVCLDADCDTNTDFRCETCQNSLLLNVLLLDCVETCPEPLEESSGSCVCPAG